MPVLDVDGVRVNFPFEPYACQVTYMEKVIKCLKESVNGLLESPTGTGKTLCLLCSSLAWQESRKAQAELNRQVNISELLGEKATTVSAQGIQNLAKNLESSTGSSWGGSEFSVPKIIYASRTHSQLSQAVQELKRTAYNSVKVSVIGSRDQLCIHEQIKKEQNNTNKVHMCRAKVNSRTCYYYNHLEDLKQNSEPRVLMGNVVDIEDLVGYGQKNKVCPYYMARELKSDADIIFMPYNYLLDPKTRKAHGVDLPGNVIIFDEAHNLEKICEDSASFDLKPGDLATAIEEVVRVSEKMLELVETENGGDGEHIDTMGETDFNLDDLLKLKATFQDIEREIDAVEIPNSGKGVTKPGKFMFELLAKASVVFDNKNIILDVLDKVITYITTDASGAGTGVTKGAGLSKMSDVLKKIFSQEVAPGGSVTSHQEKIAKSYKVHIIQDDSGKKKKQMDLWTNSGPAEKSGKVLSYWCFSPGHSMNDLLSQGIKCIILTSGTLSPLSSFSAEMQIPFPVTLENPHVIQQHQVWIGVLKKGPDGTVLNSNYETRFTPKYQAALGNSVVNFARIVPNGLLIFYPSYPVMEKCLEYWKEVNIFSRIEQYKQIFVEPKSKGVLNEVMEDFYSKINDPGLNGAIFVAVCRGKVSEGLDFSDINGRAVVITGLPYPPYLDPKVVLKMQYLDEMKGKQGFQSLSGKEWYKQQATRAVNQAIGRVIRHKEDFGAIMLCDTRFSYADAVRQLPVWVRPYTKTYETFGLSLKDIMFFFKHAEKTMPAPKPPKNRSSSASSGAYFMPTVTRSSSTSGHVEKAYCVQQHVPSLKRQKDEPVSVGNLTQQYQGNTQQCQGKRSSSESSSQKSLFAALDHSEDTSYGSGDIYSQIPSYQPCNIQRKPQNKKKIVIKRSGSESSTVIGQETSEVSSKMGMSHINTAENYLAEVKSLLSVDSYKLFSKALMEYKKDENLLKVIAVLADLFTEDKRNYHLFAKFYRFVRPHHKKQFHQMCLDLTGLKTSYKPEDSVNKKRLREESTATNKDNSKKAKHSSEEANPKIMGKENTVCNGTTSTTTCDRLPSLNSDCDTILNNNRNNTESATNVDSEQKADQKVQSDIQTRKVSDSHDIMWSVAKTKSGYKCCLCNEEAQAPFQSKCGHVCCMRCWRTVFEGDKLCPCCKERVRRRHLDRLFFRSGVDFDSDKTEISGPS